MENFEKIKNKFYIICFVNIFLEYTNKKITNFKILDIEFVLKEEYFINSFNDIFKFLMIYYFIIFSYETLRTINSQHYIEIQSEHEKSMNKYKNFSVILKKGLAFSDFILNFNFINILLPFLIFYIALYLIIDSWEIFLFCIIIPFIVLMLLAYFEKKKLIVREKEFINININNYKELNKLKEHITNKPIETMNEYEKKVIFHVLKTIENRIEKNKKIYFTEKYNTKEK